MHCHRNWLAQISWAARAQLAIEEARIELHGERAKLMHYHCNSVIGRPVQFVGLPVSEQSAHHAADQATWTAPPTTVMVSTTPAATTGQMVIIELVAAAGTGVRR